MGRVDDDGLAWVALEVDEGDVWERADVVLLPPFFWDGGSAAMTRPIWASMIKNDHECFGSVHPPNF